MERVWRGPGFAELECLTHSFPRYAIAKVQPYME